MTSRAGVLLALLSTLALAACSASRDNGDETDAELRLRPRGTENMARVTVQLPSTACLPGGSCSHPVTRVPSITIDGTVAAIGVELAIAPGDHTLRVDETTATMSFVAGPRTLTLPVAREVCTDDTGTALPATQFGKQPGVHRAACPSLASSSRFNGQPVYFNTGYNCTGGYYGGGVPSAEGGCNGMDGIQALSLWNGSVGCVNLPVQAAVSACQTLARGNCNELGAPGLCTNANPFTSGGDVAVAPAEYEFMVETANGPTSDKRQVREGEIAELAFSLPLLGAIPDRFTTELSFADARELADSATATITSECGNDYSVPATASGTVSLQAFQFAECHYTLNAGGRTVALAQNETNRITLHRLDIDDVEVTRDDGSKFVTRGTYEVYNGGLLVAGPYPTNGGIDMLPGEYEIVVKYRAADSANDKINRYPVTF